eukprot:6026485-Prymnesium_polylepis.2
MLNTCLPTTSVVVGSSQGRKWCNLASRALSSGQFHTAYTHLRPSRTGTCLQRTTYVRCLPVNTGICLLRRHRTECLPELLESGLPRSARTPHCPAMAGPCQLRTDYILLTLPRLDGACFAGIARSASPSCLKVARLAAHALCAALGRLGLPQRTQDAAAAASARLKGARVARCTRRTSHESREVTRRAILA